MMLIATCTRSIGLALVAIVVLAARPAAAGDESATLDRVARLIRQLGSDSFSQRERASRELVTLGVAAREALDAATTDPDAEIRARARVALSAVTEREFRDRLEAFSADYDGSRNQTLPGWEKFAAELGSSRLSRQLFVEMQRAEPELLEGYAEGGKTAGDALDARCRMLLVQLTQVSSGEGPVSLGTMASLLLVGSAEEVSVDQQLAHQLYTWLIYRPAFQKLASGGMWAPMMKKLLGMWIVKDASPAATAQNLMFAASYELKPEGLSLAGKLLASDGTAPQVRQFALLSIGRFGSRQHLAAVEKYLQDGNVCGSIRMNKFPRQMQVQVRDVALAVLLHLTDQEVRDYGAATVQPNPQAYFQVPALAFSTDGARDVALERWHAWRAEHPQP
jgi:hypothetical protein